MELRKRDFLAGAFGASLIGATALSARAEDAAVKGDSRFNVRDFGAKGDGKASDTAALQKALDAAGAVSGTVWFPAGEYLCRDLKVPPHVCLLADPVWIYRNEKAGACLVQESDDASCVLDVTNGFGSHLCGLTLVGRRSSPKPAHGIFLNNASAYSPKENTIVIDDCKVSGFSGCGVKLLRIWLFIIRHSMFGGNAGSGVEITGWDGFVLDNQFSGNGGCGFDCKEVGATVMFSSNRVEWNHSAGLHIPSGDAWNVTGNCFDRNGGPAIAAERVSASSITGNVFRRCGASGKGMPDGEPSCQLRLEACSGLTVTGNTGLAGIDDGGKGILTPQTGIVLKGMKCSIVALNTFSRGYTEKMIVDLGGNAEDFILKDNVGSADVRKK
jgi:hypothetical protein